MANAINVSDAKKIIDQIVRLLQMCPYFKVNEVIKGGSLGHGTVVPGHFDADLVLYSESFSESGMLNPATTTGWAMTLDQFLRQHQPGYALKDRIKGHVLSFKVMFGGYKEVKVDLLLSPYYAEQAALLSSLSQYKAEVMRQPNPDDLWPKIVHTFSASASKWQVERIKQLPDQIKELIKRAKKWRNDQWPDHLPNSGKPKSYLMAVLVISACRDYKEELGCRSYQEMVQRVNMDTLARRVTTLMRADVQNHRSFCISWEEQLEEYPSAQPSQPFILDPANPFNNMYLSGVAPCKPGEMFEYAPGNGKWGPFAEKVRSLDLRP